MKYDKSTFPADISLKRVKYKIFHSLTSLLINSSSLNLFRIFLRSTHKKTKKHNYTEKEKNDGTKIIIEQ